MMDDYDDNDDGLMVMEVDENVEMVPKAKIKIRPGVRIPIKDTILTGGKQVMMIDDHNYMFRKNKTRNETTYWICQHKNCKVTGVVTITEPGHVTCRGVHSHLSNACRVEALILESKLVARALENPTIKPRVLFSDIISTPNVHEDVIMSLPSQLNLTQKIHNERSKLNMSDVREPKSFVELVENMPEALKHTNSGERFLSYSG